MTMFGSGSNFLDTFRPSMKTMFNRANEPFWFLLMALMHLLPVLMLTPFVTLDGAAHLYNAHLIHQLMGDGADGLISAYFSFNNFPEPNWSGHLILVVLMNFMSPLVAEKVFLLAVLLSTLYGYRHLILKMEPSAVWVSWLLFPLLYNFPFLLGFYNFCLALALLPWLLLAWMNMRPLNRSLRSWSIFSFGLLMLYFSHPVVFLLFGISTGMMVLCCAETRGELFTQSKLLVLPMLPGLLLFTAYMTENGWGGYKGDVVRLPLAKLVEDILSSRMLIVYDFTSEQPIAILYTVLMVALSVPAIRYRTVQRFQRSTLLLMLFSLLLVFVLPDSMASGGILTVRLILWMFLCWIVWLSTLRVPERYSVAAALFSVIFSFGMMYLHYNTQKGLSREGAAFVLAADKIKNSSTVLPINYSGNWMHANLASYLGMGKDIVVLDNYEADYELFPIVWQEGMKPELHLGNHASSNLPCVDIQASERITGKVVQYVSVWKEASDNKDSCHLELQKNLLYFYLSKTVLPEGLVLHEKR